MYLATSRLPHLLSPRDYFDPSAYDRELGSVFQNAWHFVATRADLPRSGDFATFELFGRPVLLLNWDGEYVAAANVCAHRHCLLTNVPRGNSPTLRCQYHGWEYDAEGRTTHIPQAKLFAPLDQKTRPHLAMFRTALCGQLIFVCLTADGPSLREQLGDVYDICAERFSGDWRQSLSLEPTFPANWKVPVENALESYHVPALHAQTFKEDPGEARSMHRLEPNYTEFATQLPFSLHSRFDAWIRRLEDLVLRTLGETVTQRYRHVHCFPNLLLSFTDALSLAQCVLPTSTTTSRAVVRQFGVARQGKPAWQRGLARAWGRASAQITRQILAEDFGFYDQVQLGLQASRQAGMLGRCEERIHVFQKWLIEQAERPRQFEPVAVVAPLPCPTSACQECL